MAIFSFEMKVIQRSQGYSSTAAAAYCAGMTIEDERTGEVHNFENRGGVLSHDILAPSRAPDWAKEANSLWNAVEMFERRKDAQVARENIVALPHELTFEQNRDLLHAFVQDAYVHRGMAAQANMHAADPNGDERNIHGHILLTMRGITRNGFKERKARNWNETQTLEEWRALWADHVNRALERAGFEVRVDHRSYEDQGIDREPTKHMGKAATEMQRRGENSRIDEENREITRRNQQLEQLEKQQQILNRVVAAEAKKITEQRRAQMEAAKREREEREKREDLKSHDALLRRAGFTHWQNKLMQQREELLARGPKWWTQIEKDFAQEEAAIRASQNVDALREKLAEAKAQAAQSDNVHGRFTGAYTDATENLRTAQLNFQEAQKREREQLETLKNNLDYLRHAKEEREAQINREMTTKLRHQFERQKGGMEAPEMIAAPEQDNAGMVVDDSGGEEQEQGRSADDGMEISR